MSSPNQNAILAHRSIYGNSSQNESSSTEYKTVTIQKKIATPRRLVNEKVTNNAAILQFNEKSQLQLQIANLKDEITQLNKSLDEKTRGYSSSELSSIYYLNQKPKTIEPTYEKYQEFEKLTKNIEELTEIFGSDSINRLRKSNQSQKKIIQSIHEELGNKNEQIQEIQTKINKFKNSDIYIGIVNQRKSISEKHQQIHNAVELHRKIKEEMRQLEDYDPKRIKELEKTLLEAQENKKRITKKYQALRKKQKKERIEAEAEKLRRSHKFAISTMMQSFEICENNINNDNIIQESIVTFERFLSEAEKEPENENNSIPILQNNKGYIQEDDIQLNSDFEIAAQLLSESEEEEFKSSKQEIEEEAKPGKRKVYNMVKSNKQINKEEIKSNKKVIEEEDNEPKFEEEEEESECNKKVELVNNSIQCELKDDLPEKQENNENESQKGNEQNISQHDIEINKSVRDKLPSFLFPPESEIESTSIVYSESDFSSAQIEIMKKGMKKQKSIQINFYNDQNKTEVELNDKLTEYLSSYESDSNYNIKKENNNDYQSESTSIYNSSIDSFSENNIQNAISDESTSIVTSASYFKFTKESESSSYQKIELNQVKKKITQSNNVMKFDNDKSKGARKEKQTMIIDGSEDLNSEKMIILKTSKPISFESLGNSEQLQLSTMTDKTEYNDYFSSQSQENDIEITKSIFSITNSYNRNSIGPKKKSIKMFTMSDYSSDFETNSMDSLRRRRLKKTNTNFTNCEDSSSSLFDKNEVSNCQLATLMSATDDERHSIEKNKIVEDDKLQKNSSSFSNRRQKKVANQSDICNDDDSDVLDNKFIVEDDRKILKVGSFSEKPSKKGIMPYFARFGTVNSCAIKQDGSNYYAFVAFKKHDAAKNAKKNLKGSKIDGTRLKIVWESDNKL